MKKIILPLLLVLLSFNTYSQYKGNPGKAKSSLEKSKLKSNEDEIKELLIIAKGEIDLAVQIEKQKNKANTWLIRGDVYTEIIKRGFLDLDSESLSKAIEAYDKIGSDVQTKDAMIIQNTVVGKQNLYVHYVNEAINFQQGGDEPNYEESFKSWQSALLVNPNDTLSMLYSAFAAEGIGRYDIALDYYNSLIKFIDKNKGINLDSDDNILNKRTVNSIYQNAVNILYTKCDQFNECESYSKTQTLINSAKNILPNENFFYNVEINIAVALNNVEEARKKVEERLLADPNNPGLHFNRAVLYYNLGINISENYNMNENQKLDSLDKVYKSSIESFINTLQLDPNNERALLYILDAYKANAKPYYDLERNLDYIALGPKKYQSEAKRLKNEGDTRLNDAVVYAQAFIELKGEEISNDEIGTIYPIFSFLDNYDSLIKILSIAISRDNTNIEYLSALREAYNKTKDYDNAIRIEKEICVITDGTWSDQYGCE